MKTFKTCSKKKNVIQRPRSARQFINSKLRKTQTLKSNNSKRVCSNILIRDCVKGKVSKGRDLSKLSKRISSNQSISKQKTFSSTKGLPTIWPISRSRKTRNWMSTKKACSMNSTISTKFNKYQRKILSILDLSLKISRKSTINFCRTYCYRKLREPRRLSSRLKWIFA